jgi:hypothetical protein
MKVSTRNFTPRANEEGEIGVVGKVWKALRAKIVEATSKMTAPTVEATSKMTAPTVEATSKMTAPTVEATSKMTAPTVEVGDKSKNVATTEFVKNRENMVVSPFLLQRNTAYKIGDMVKVPKLGEQYILECTQAGTTGNTEPNLSTISMQEITDGSAKFRVVDKRLKAMIDILYPVGIVVTTATDGALKPGEADGLATWEEIAQDRVLQGTSGGAGQTIESGLPNITGKVWLRPLDNGEGITWDKENGAFMTKVVEDPNDISGAIAKSSTTKPFGSINLDASKSNSIYGNSSTVQPPAYKVHFWKRIK